MVDRASNDVNVCEFLNENSSGFMDVGGVKPMTNEMCILDEFIGNFDTTDNHTTNVA